MIRRIVLLMVIFVLSLSTSALAAEPGSGMIEGRVANGTAGGSSVADQDVTLKTYQNDAEVGATTTKADAEGRFVFDGLPTESDYSYQVELNFQEADYYGEWLGFTEGEITKSTEITVYEATTSDEAIKVVTAHTIIYVGQDSLQVMEFYLFVNESDQTYIGSQEVNAEGKRETLRFSLPKEATELQPGYGLMECCIVSSEEGFTDTMPVLPGSREIVYSYKVDYNSGVYEFSQRVNYPINGFALLVQGEAIQVISDQLIGEEPVSIEETVFNHVSGSDFAPGNILMAQLSGLSQTNNQGVSGLPQTNNQGAILEVVLALVVLGAAFGFVYLARKGRLRPVRAQVSLQESRQKLLVELAQLDDEFEAGKIPEEIYHRLRVEKKASLVELMQRLNGESGQGG
ncbi:carboxypeptidase-like regulatory domain-containing protein [Chloroflexota bacterium]